MVAVFQGSDARDVVTGQDRLPPPLAVPTNDVVDVRVVEEMGMSRGMMTTDDRLRATGLCSRQNLSRRMTVRRLRTNTDQIELLAVQDVENSVPTHNRPVENPRLGEKSTKPQQPITRKIKERRPFFSQ